MTNKYRRKTIFLKLIYNMTRYELLSDLNFYVFLHFYQTLTC